MVLVVPSVPPSVSSRSTSPWRSGGVPLTGATIACRVVVDGGALQCSVLLNFVSRFLHLGVDKGCAHFSQHLAGGGWHVLELRDFPVDLVQT